MRSAVRSTTALLMGLVGFGFSANALAAQGTDLRSQRVQDLKSLVLARADDAVQAEADVRRLQQEVDEVAVEFSTPQLRRLREEIGALRSKTGLRALTGPGLIVTLDDAPRSAVSEDPDIGADWLIVHQEDLEAVINSLWRGGAEGITVMGQRIINTSAVRCVGSTVLVNGKVFSPPFVIEAVGDPKALREALDLDVSVGYFEAVASTFGLTYDVRQAANLYLDPYRGGLSAQYAGPLE